ncbi:MAG: DUF3313 domain-containing protein [Victivallales bacterium]|nr:DUF3313 domain-containing protein [Victivallales bacterium]MCF7889154.1 DUF3313 domain-containing protein [Victivallales bacterium]
MKKLNYKITGNIFFIKLIIFCLCGCRANEAPPAGFIKNPQYMYKDPFLPFHRAWIRKDFNLNAYNKIIIYPVNMNYLKAPETVGKLNFHNYNNYLERNKKHLAEFTRKAIINAFNKIPGNRFEVVNYRGYGTLVLKIAVVDFVPTKSVMNSAGTGLMFIPITSIPLTVAFGLITLPLKAALRGTTDSGFEASVAIEAVICESVTKKVMVAFADRVSAPAAIFHVDDYSYWAHVENIINRWAVQIVTLMNRKSIKTKIEGQPKFLFKPW